MHNETKNFFFQKYHAPPPIKKDTSVPDVEQHIQQNQLVYKLTNFVCLKKKSSRKTENCPVPIQAKTILDIVCLPKLFRKQKLIIEFFVSICLGILVQLPFFKI